MPDPFRFPVTTLGRAVRECLASGRHGRVLAVFRRSFYLEMDDGALACFGPRGMGAGPLNALCDLAGGLDWRASGLNIDMPCHVDGDAVAVGGRFRFDFGEAVPWRPILPETWTKATLAAGLTALHRRSSEYHPSEGRSALTGPALDALTGWIEAGDGGHPPPEAIGLIGLGTGLTPSGDDFIGGALIALRTLGRADAADLLARWVAPLAAEKTGKISIAHLSCARAGEGAAALHGVIAAVCADRQPGLEDHLRAVDSIGHSSGWDALAGAVAVIASIAAR